MTAIYVLADSNLPDPNGLERQITDTVGDRYAVKTFPGLPALLNALEEVRQAVVIFSAPVAKMPGLIRQCRQALSGTAFVALLHADDAAQKSASLPILETDCHFIPHPFDSFALLTQLSGAIRQAELLATVSDAAQLDEVTSLFNRRAFIKRLGEEVSLSRRHLSPLCCVVLGVNFYQMYLDSYGYDFINALFRFIADKITASIRHEDIVARISDDEIGILLPRSTEKGARVFTNRLILNLNASVFRFGDYEEEISVCAGLIGYPLSDETPADADTLIRYGRHALHQARCSETEHVPLQLFSEIKPAF